MNQVNHVLMSALSGAGAPLQSARPDGVEPAPAVVESVRHRDYSRIAWLPWDGQWSEWPKGPCSPVFEGLAEPKRTNPHHDEAAEAVSRLTRCLAIERADGYLYGAGIGSLTSWVYPRSSRPVFELQLLIMLAFFLIDDAAATEAGRRRLSEWHQIVDHAELTGVATESRSSGIHGLLAEILRRTAVLSWRGYGFRRFRTGLLEFLESCGANSAPSSVVESGLEGYFQRRLRDVAALPCFDLTELELRLQLDPKIWGSRAFQRLRSTAALHIALVNDVWSFDNERSQSGELNIVPLLASHFGCSELRASGLAVHAANHCLRTFDRTVMSTYLDHRARRVAQSLRAWMTSSLYWHGCSSRYRAVGAR